MIAVGLIIIISGIAFGTGRVLLDRLAVQHDSLLEEFVYSTALGLAVLIYTVLILGLAGYLYYWSVGGILLCSGICTFAKIRELCLQIWRYPRRGAWPSLSVFEKFLVCCLGLFGLVNLLLVLSPPTYGDGIHYLFPTAQTYIRHHRIEFIPYLYSATRPKNMVMLYVLGYLFQGDILAQLFNFVLTVLTNLLLYTTTKKYTFHSSCPSGSREYALLAVVIFYTMPLIQKVAGNALSEPGVLLYGFLAFHAFLLWSQTLQFKWIILSGVFSGVCIGFKVIGVEVPLIIGLFVFFLSWKIHYHSAKQKSFRTLVLLLSIFCVTAAVVGCPWYWLTYKWTGNPLYKAKENIGYFWEKYVHHDAESAFEVPSVEPSHLEPQDSHSQDVKEQSPLLAIYHQVSSNIFRSGPKKLAEAVWNISMTKGYQGYVITPLYLAFLPVFFLFPLKNKNISLPVWLSVIYCVVGLNLWGPYTRYIIAIFPVLSVITARVIQNIYVEYKRVGQFCKLVCVLLLLLYFPATVHKGINKTPVALGLETREAHLKQYLSSSFEVIRYVNHQIPETAKILLMGEYRLFLFERDYLVGGYLSLLMRYQYFRDPHDAYRRLKLLKVTHVILNQRKSNNSGYKDKDNYIEHFKEKYLEYLYHDSDVYLYKLKGTP